MLAEATGGISMAVYLGQAVLNKIVFRSTDPSARFYTLSPGIKTVKKVRA